MLVGARLAVGSILAAQPDSRNPSWDDLKQAWPSRELVEGTDIQAVWSWPELEGSCQQTISPLVVSTVDSNDLARLAELPTEEDEIAVAADTSGTSSSPSEASEPDFLCHETDPEQVVWWTTSGLGARIHLPRDHDLPGSLTCCGRLLRRPRAHRGLTAAAQSGRQWSPRCFSHLGDEAKRQWAVFDV